MTPRTKPGKYGTLYLYELAYTDDLDPVAFGQSTQRTWAYDMEHAKDNFWGGADGDAGWRLLSIARVPESGLMHRVKQYSPMHQRMDP